MSYEPKKVFVKNENGTYTELTYQKFCTHRENDESYESRYFIPLHGVLVEVSIEGYKDFYRASERDSYLEELNELHGLISVEDFFISDEVNKTPYQYDIDDVVDRNLMFQKLHECIAELKENEQKIINGLFFEGLTEVEIAEELGISQAAVSKGKKHSLRKLKKMMDGSDCV